MKLVREALKSKALLVAAFADFSLKEATETDRSSLLVLVAFVAAPRGEEDAIAVKLLRFCRSAKLTGASKVFFKGISSWTGFNVDSAEERTERTVVQSPSRFSVTTVESEEWTLIVPVDSWYKFPAAEFSPWRVIDSSMSFVMKEERGAVMVE